MPISQVLEISRDLFYTTFLLALPSLAVSLIVGLIISILQTITSIQEQTLTFVPRLMAVGLVIMFTTAWSLQLSIYFTVRMIWYVAEATQR